MCIDTAADNIIPFPYAPDWYVDGNVVPKIIRPVSSSMDNPEKDLNVSFSTEELEKIHHEEIILQYRTEIQNVIQNDEFVDGAVSNSERYIQENCNDDSLKYIKSALMNMYLDNLDNEKILTGILLMISCIPYDVARPEGPIMAMGLLQNKNNGVRDRAVQAFERWNSKKGISILKSLYCDRRWLQRYVEKVITYLERDGID